MSEPDNLIIKLLQDIREKQQQHTEQFESLQIGMHALAEKELAHSTDSVRLNASVQELTRRLNRVERRLELRDAEER